MQNMFNNETMFEIFRNHVLSNEKIVTIICDNWDYENQDEKDFNLHTKTKLKNYINKVENSSLYKLYIKETPKKENGKFHFFVHKVGEILDGAYDANYQKGCYNPKSRI